MSTNMTNSTNQFQPESSRMPLPSNSITPRTIRAIMPPCRLSASLRQAILAVPEARLPERVNPPDQRAAAPAQNPESTFPRIYPMNPEPPTALAQNPNSTFLRIYPLNPEPTAAPAPTLGSAFSRTNPPASEPAPAPTPNPGSTGPRINPGRSTPSPHCPDVETMAGQFSCLVAACSAPGESLL
jgi:hypothetical protein